MSMTAKEVRAKAESSNIPGCKVCAVSFDGSWQRRGYFSNQEFAGAIEVKGKVGKVIDYVLYERVCNKCIKWTEERKKENPGNTANTGRNIRANAQLTSLEQVRRWNLLLQ